MKPKQERTLDQADLASQFQAGPVQTTKEESKDSPDKISARMGIHPETTDAFTGFRVVKETE